MCNLQNFLKVLQIPKKAQVKQKKEINLQVTLEKPSTLQCFQICSNFREDIQIQNHLRSVQDTAESQEK